MKPSGTLLDRSFELLFFVLFFLLGDCLRRGVGREGGEGMV